MTLFALNSVTAAAISCHTFFFKEFASIQSTSLLRYRFSSDLGTLWIEKRLISCYVPTFIRYIFRVFLQKCLLLLKQPWFNIFQLFMRFLQFQWRHFVCAIHQNKTKLKKHWNNRIFLKCTANWLIQGLR